MIIILNNLTFIYKIFIYIIINLLGLSSFNLYLIQSGEVGCFIDEKTLHMKLKAGQSFGELAYTFNRASKTSYKCLEACQIYVVQRQDIPTILKDFERQHQARITAPIFKPSAFFDDWDLGSISYLYYYGKIQNYVRNQTVYLQNSPPDGIYLIVSGEFSYSIKQKSDKKHLHINQDGEINSDDERIQLEKDVYVLRNHKISKTFVSKISTMSAGQMFGEEVLKKSNRNFDTTCESVEGTVIFFTSQVFWSLIYSNPSAKIIFDNKLKKQDFVQKRQINYIKSSMDDYDHYLLGKQYAHAEKTENNDDTQNSNGSPLLRLSRNVSKKQSNDGEKKQQQIKDEIKNAIEKIPILDLKKINDSAKQFNQYSFDPKEEKFNNPNESDQNEVGSGNLTNRNLFKMQMRTNSTINNQYQLEFLKVQLPKNIQSGSISARNPISNFSHSYSSTPLNNQGQNTPFRSKIGSSSQEEIERIEISPYIQKNDSKTVQEDGGLKANNLMHFNNNAHSSKINMNSLNIPLNSLNTNSSFNTPINQNPNNQTPIYHTSMNQTPKSNNTNTITNNHELFELILQNNSKKFGKQYIRMKKFIQEGEQMNINNRKKYSLQNIFGSERSTPRALITQITHILQEKSNSISLPFSPISQSQQQQKQLDNTATFNNSKDQNNQNQQINQDQTSTHQNNPENIIDGQDEYINTSRKQSYNYLIHKQLTSTPNNRVQDNIQVSPNNPPIKSKQVTQKQLKQLHISSFANALMYHSANINQNGMNQQINQQKHKVDSPSTSSIHIQKQIQLEDKIDNLQVSDKRNNSQNQKQITKTPNLQLLLGSQTQRDFKEDEQDQNRNRNMKDGGLSTETDLDQGKNQDGNSKTERSHLSKTSQSGVRITKIPPQKQYFSNRVIQGFVSKSPPQLNTENSNQDTLTTNVYSLTSRYSNNQDNQQNIGQFTERKSSSIHQKEQKFIKNKDNLYFQEATQQQQLQIDDDQSNKLTPLYPHKHKKVSSINQFYESPDELIGNDSYQNSKQKFMGFNLNKHQSQPALVQMPQLSQNLSQPTIKYSDDTQINEIQKDHKEQNQNDYQQSLATVAFDQINFQVKQSQRIRLKSDMLSIKKQINEDQTQQKYSSSENQKINHQMQLSSQNLNNPALNNQKLVLNQTRPLYHDSNSTDSKGKAQKLQSKSITNQKEQLLQKHIIAKFHIQEPQKITSFLENIADSQKNKKQHLPQQFVYSYTPNQYPPQLNNQTQNLKDNPILQLFQQNNNHKDENTKSPVQDKQLFSNKSQKRQSQNIDTPDDQVMNMNSDKKGKESSTFSNDYQICEDLGYNFVKRKQQ